MCRTLTPKTELMLHESLVYIRQSITIVTEINSLSVPSRQSGLAGVENAIKAPVVQHHEDVPGKFRDHSLVTVCHSTGLWGVLLPQHRDALDRISGLGGIQTRDPTTPQYQQFISSSDPVQWKAVTEQVKTLRTSEMGRNEEPGTATSTYCVVPRWHVGCCQRSGSSRPIESGRTGRRARRGEWSVRSYGQRGSS
jgi:hypothetical protein